MVMIVAEVIIIAAVVAVRVIVALVVIVAVPGRVLCRSRRRHECHRERANYRKLIKVWRIGSSFGLTFSPITLGDRLPSRQAEAAFRIRVAFRM